MTTHLPLKALLAAVLLSMGALASTAASAAVLDFDTLSGANNPPFTSYSQDGFTLVNTAGQFYVGGVFGNPAPSIFSGRLYGSPSAAVTLTAAGGADFIFSAFDFASNNGATSYVLTGFQDGAEIFNISATSSVTSGFITLTPGTASSVVDLVTLSFTGSGTSFNLDNIVVNAATVPVPEPASLALFSMGLLGLGLTRARRA
ncbi:PEP-CTERM sorting domain-containing protein [Roseomonas marmotae]|uniref:PEP-CTERM sorting domain-containing protein n=1 Tax=Roseomonas marmotae TaxID=2768161 RepID=A0ABS3KC40_9PROT|nr:PEP-CTERM sorting domain-containing protein [Roseomonas marmotae]MBO1075038.1 PEP-CTERM sorting domain-containing protein [Roseomonas marmotae]QTI79928.1 PEP-CTERM sorting domain-containing protein [Roseomonas marmotae]